MPAAKVSAEGIRGSLEEALTEVLETMFFELPLDQPAVGSPAAGAIGAEALFTGDAEGKRLGGRFQMAVEPPMLSRLAQDFLGLDELEPPCAAQTASVLCELANMLCGSTLSRVAPEARLRIAPPSARSVAELLAEGGDTAWIDTPLECGRIWVRVEVREDA